MDNTQSLKFNFLLKGNNGKAVLLIHGITGTPSEMHYLGKSLNKAGFTVMCNILPRHCDTLKELKKVRWQEIAEACIKDFNNLKKEYSRVFVGGISMGALMSVHLAYLFKGEVAGILALAPTIFYDGWALHKGKALIPLLWRIPFVRRNMSIREGWPYGVKDEYLRKNIERFYKNSEIKQFDNKVLLFGSPFFPLACLYQHHIFTKVVEKELPAVTTPILIVHAKEDDMTSPRNAEYVLRNIASGDKSLILLEDSYHMITIDKDKDRVASEAVNFFKRL